MLDTAEQKQVVKYDITDAAIVKMEGIYMNLTITDLADKEQFDTVHAARMVVKGHRVAVEKKRKELKADALEYGRRVDGEAKRIFSLLEPIESHLMTEEQKVIDEQNRAKAEKEAEEKAAIEARIEKLLAVQCVMAFQDVAILTHAEFDDLLAAKTDEYEKEMENRAKLEAEEKAEKERLAKQKAEQDAKEAELKRQADELAAQVKALQDEKDRIAREEAEKKAAEEAKIKAEKEAKEKAERETREAEEREKAEAEAKVRAEALKPDKEKLINWLNFFNLMENNPAPDLKEKESNELFETIHGLFEVFLRDAFEMVEKL